jgi:hypothetical protein
MRYSPGMTVLDRVKSWEDFEMVADVKRIGPALLRVRVHLIDSDPKIWRLIELDANLPLPQVHDALQIVMGWQNSHLHEFLDFNPDLFSNVAPIRPRRWATPFLREDDDEGIYLPEENTVLRDVLTDKAPLFYVYDLGDHWLHRLDLIETLPPDDGPRVRVIRGERRCPLEDSGGIDGYHHLLHVLDHPEDDEHHDLTDWVASIHNNPRHPFDPATYNTKTINQALQRALPRTSTPTEP